jgi:hypothetical protein
MDHPPKNPFHPEQPIPPPSPLSRSSRRALSIGLRVGVVLFLTKTMASAGHKKDVGVIDL